MYKIQPNSSIVGKNLIYLPSCHSTNDIAKELIHQKAPSDGTVVITGVQTAGKGLRGNTWEVEPHTNLTFSVILYPNGLTPQRIFDLTVAMSLGLVHALQRVGLPKAQLKWPNDIYLGQKKMGGMLLEPAWSGNQCASCVVGIGLNINQQTWQNAPRATSLALETQRTWELEKLLPVILESLDQSYLDLRNPANRSSMFQTYFQHLIGYQAFRRYKSQGIEWIAKIVGVDEWGRLLLEGLDGQRHEFDVKEIEFCWD